jgi:HEAT repeat protein
MSPHASKSNSPLQDALNSILNARGNWGLVEHQAESKLQVEASFSVLESLRREFGLKVEKMRAVLSDNIEADIDSRNSRDYLRQVLEPFGKDTLPLLVKLFEEPDRDIRRIALTAAGILREKAWPAIESIAKLGEDEDILVIETAFKALAHIGRKTVPQVSGKLTHSNADVRENALRALEKLGTHAETAIAAICGLIKNDPVPFLKTLAIRILPAVTKSDTEAVEVLLDAAANGSHPDIRAAAATALGNFTVLIETIVPALKRQFDTDTSQTACNAAARALENLGYLTTGLPLPRSTT